MKQKQFENLLSELKYSNRVSPDPLFKINSKKRLLNRITSLENLPISQPIFAFPFRIYKPFRFAIATLSIFLLLGGGTVFASQSSLPTEPLYPLKTASEDLLLNVAPLPSWKKELSVAFVNRRINEIEEVEEKYGKDSAEAALGNFEESLNKAKKYGNSSEELERLGNPKKKFEERIINNPEGSGQVYKEKENAKGSTIRQDKPKTQQPQESKPKDVKPKSEELKNQTNSSQNSKSEKGNPLPKK